MKHYKDSLVVAKNTVKVVKIFLNDLDEKYKDPEYRVETDQDSTGKMSRAAHDQLRLPE